ncbi:MAG: VCBS repeat-containing protein [Planctomycetes bacterium]|nr:VCBS repeat-containing protein [Planctomycetota bacterium]MCC7169966.1 VCBS repeat-containing protein [Planctomycetota bacterium]
MLVVGLLAATLAEPEFVESRLEFPGRVLSYECPDINDDSRGDLFVVTREDEDRVLNYFAAAADGSFPDAPTWRLALPADVVAYGLFEARPDPGLEILLFSARGVYSLSTTKAGLKDNLVREIEIAVFPGLADPDMVPRWSLAKDLDGDGVDELLVTTKYEIAVHRAPRPQDGKGFVRIGTIPARPDDESPRARGRFDRRAEIRIETSLLDLFRGSTSSVPRFEQLRYLEHSQAMRVPALVDWNGDGRVDAIPKFDAAAIEVFEQHENLTFDATPKKVEFAIDESDDARIQLLDLDGDGRSELFVEREDGDGLSRDHVVTVFARGADGLFAKDARARVKLNASDVDWSVLDVDHDGRVDLVARVVDLPLGITDLAAVRLEMKLLVFRGQGGGELSRKPDFAFERSLKPEQMERIRESFVLDLGGDFDGDGINDLLSMQADGLLEITAVERDGNGLRLAAKTLTRHRPANPVRGTLPAELSHDGVSDLVLRHEKALTVFVSRGGGQR